MTAPHEQYTPDYHHQRQRLTMLATLSMLAYGWLQADEAYERPAADILELVKTELREIDAQHVRE